MSDKIRRKKININEKERNCLDGNSSLVDGRIGSQLTLEHATLQSICKHHHLFFLTLCVCVWVGGCDCVRVT